MMQDLFQSLHTMSFIPCWTCKGGWGTRLGDKGLLYSLCTMSSYCCPYGKGPRCVDKL